MSDDAHGHHGPKWLAHHFDTPVQQFDTAKLGMWAFLVQELLFFSGLFVAYGVYRSWYPEMFKAASHQLDKIMGGTNTIVLLFSSFTSISFAVSGWPLSLNSKLLRIDACFVSASTRAFTRSGLVMGPSAALSRICFNSRTLRSFNSP